MPSCSGTLVDLPYTARGFNQDLPSNVKCMVPGPRNNNRLWGQMVLWRQEDMYFPRWPSKIGHNFARCYHEATEWHNTRNHIYDIEIILGILQPTITKVSLIRLFLSFYNFHILGALRLDSRTQIRKAVEVNVDIWELTNHSKLGKSEGFESCARPSNLKLDSIRRFFSPCDRDIWWMTFKPDRALLYYVKLCASIQIHWWIQTVTVQKTLNSDRKWR